MTFYIRLSQLLSQLSFSGIKLARSRPRSVASTAELAASVKELEAFTYSVSHDSAGAAAAYQRFLQDFDRGIRLGPAS